MVFFAIRQDPQPRNFVEKVSLAHGNKDGSSSNSGESALLLIDLINPLDFPEAAQLARYLPAMTRAIRRLKQRAQKAGVPVIYVNDNFGRWRSDFRSQGAVLPNERISRLRNGQTAATGGKRLFILKPKHSGFFATTLDTLSRYLGARRLILAGIAGHFCVLFTANDAYMRDYELIVPADCIAFNSARENRQALALMHKFLKADTRPSATLRLPRAATTRSR